MKLPKIIGSFLGIVFVVLTSLIIFGNYLESIKFPSDQNEREAIFSQKQEAAADLSAGALAAADLIKQEKILSPSELIQPSRQNNDAEDRAAQKISEKIAKSITELNADGLTELDNRQFLKTLNPQKIVDEVLRQELEEIERLAEAETEPIAVISADRIISGADKRQEEEYLRLFARILEVNSASIGASSISSPADFGRLVEAYQKMAAELRQLMVPERLLPFHKKELALLLGEASIWKKLMAVDQAPLEAVAALKQRERTSRDFLALKQEIGDYIKENKLAVQWQ